MVHLAPAWPASTGPLQLYSAALKKKPLLTQAVCTGALWGLGDALAQRLERRHRYDARRGLISTAFGTAAVGPFGFYFYHGLDRLAAGLFAHGSFRFIAFKTLADALVYEPLFVLSSFAVMTLGAGGSWRDVCRKVQADFWTTLAAELAVWIPIQAANFKLVRSPDVQQLVVNLLTVVDSAFISLCCGPEEWLHSGPSSHPAQQQAGAAGRQVAGGTRQAAASKKHKAARGDSKASSRVD